MVLLLLIILIGCASISTYARSGNNLSIWGNETLWSSLGGISITEELSGAMELVKQHKQEAMEEIKKELGVFFSETNAVAKQDIENYQKDYLNRLTETKEKLGESNQFEVYAGRKKEQINHEISQEVEGFLTELLSE